mmetsp:Transcript_77984/g.114158  ORF Transcript_77984/g.114158 Transcript_77984/m.114158 type:complete len:277 (+) Transcript_77984:1357-2187(+)
MRSDRLVFGKGLKVDTSSLMALRIAGPAPLAASFHLSMASPLVDWSNISASLRILAADATPIGLSMALGSSAGFRPANTGVPPPMLGVFMSPICCMLGKASAIGTPASAACRCLASCSSFRSLSERALCEGLASTCAACAARSAFSPSAFSTPPSEAILILVFMSPTTGFISPASRSSTLAAASWITSAFGVVGMASSLDLSCGMSSSGVASSFASAFSNQCFWAYTSSNCLPRMPLVACSTSFCVRKRRTLRARFATSRASRRPPKLRPAAALST